MADVDTKPLRELIEAHRGEIKAIVARHRGLSVAVFGSVARGEEGPHSDLDFLVELEPGTRQFEILELGAEPAPAGTFLALQLALHRPSRSGSGRTLRTENPRQAW